MQPANTGFVWDPIQRAIHAATVFSETSADLIKSAIITTH